MLNFAGFNKLYFTQIFLSLNSTFFNSEKEISFYNISIFSSEQNLLLETSSKSLMQIF